VARGLILLIAGVLVLQAWGVNAAGWFWDGPGQIVLQAAGSLALTLLVALVVWEGTSQAIANYLAEHDGRGTRRVRSARTRTLLSVARTALLVTLSVVVLLIVLSELGVNIAPLLATAGVLGLAVGFGAQKLVQDVITGFFMLLEDVFSVGDVIQVGDRSGLVEAVTIRNVRLRDVSGTVHTIPFSTIDRVSNLTREFSFYVFDLGVAYREDVDQVMDTLREIGAGLRRDPYFSALIIDDLEVFGVDAFGDSAVVIKGRIKTLPIKQWEVGRELNRRIKRRFDELGIEIPFPHRTLYFGVDKAGDAPPVRVRASGDRAEGGRTPMNADVESPKSTIRNPQSETLSLRAPHRTLYFGVDKAGDAPPVRVRASGDRAEGGRTPMNADVESQNPQSEIHNPKSAIRNPKSAIRNPKPKSPHRTLYFGVDKAGDAPPVRVRASGDRAEGGRTPMNADVESQNPQSAIRNPQSATTLSLRAPTGPCTSASTRRATRRRCGCVRLVTARRRANANERGC
jgi:small-conductance mechanosensitive channel